jgi:hypothetical protein
MIRATDCECEHEEARDVFNIPRRNTPQLAYGKETFLGGIVELRNYCLIQAVNVCPDRVAGGIWSLIITLALSLS